MSISIGLDVGGYNYAAAYVPDGPDQQPVILPLFPQDIEAREAPMACRLPTTYSVPSETAKFHSMKQEIDSNLPLAAYRGRPSMLTSDWVQADLEKWRQFAEDYIGESVQRVVITVAAQYSERRRSALRDCAFKAGFSEVQLINDCTAAAFGHLYNSQEAKTVLVYSSGFNGFEAGLLRVVKQHYREIGHEAAGAPSGRYFDELLMKALIDQARQSNATVPVTLWGYEGWFGFQHLVETLKKQLSVHSEISFALPAALAPSQPTVKYTAAMFEQLIQPSVAESFTLIDRLLEDADIKPSDLNMVLLVGGTTRIDYIQKQVAARFGMTPLPYESDLLARGAAIYGRYKAVWGGATVSSSAEPAPLQSGRDLSRAPVLPPVAPSEDLPEPDIEPILHYAQALIKRGDYSRATAYLGELRENISALLKQASR